MKKIALLLYTVIVLVLAASCDRRAEYLTASGAMLGTTFQATGDITDCTAQELYRAIMQIDAEAKASMSIFDSTSLLSRINRGETDSLDEHIIYNLRLAERFSRLSEGHYDVTEGHLLRLRSSRWSMPGDSPGTRRNAPRTSIRSCNS